MVSSPALRKQLSKAVQVMASAEKIWAGRVGRTWSEPWRAKNWNPTGIAALGSNNLPDDVLASGTRMDRRRVDHLTSFLPSIRRTRCPIRLSSSSGSSPGIRRPAGGGQVSSGQFLTHKSAKVKKQSHRIFRHMHRVLNEVYLQIFLHRWAVNRETNLIRLLNLCLQQWCYSNNPLIID